MPTNLIILHDMPDELMLIVEYRSGVRYQNQVGGTVCARAEQEGVLAPLDVPQSTYDVIQGLPYPQNIQGMTAEIADTIDRLLAAESGARMVAVDRARLHESYEAWVYVRIDAPFKNAWDPQDDYYGSIYGFGPARGVLTWPNSD